MFNAHKLDAFRLNATKDPRPRRRRDRSRMKRRAAQAYPNWPAAYKAADHLCLCSRACCGNPRHHACSKRERLTMQERRHASPRHPQRAYS